MAIITLVKSTFSGATELAQSVSQDLGYRLVAREDIIDKTAGYGMSEQRQDRARRRRLGVLRPMDLEWTHYLVYTRAALSKEIRDGNLVYLGDNGPALLRDFPNVLGVQVVADMEYRIDRLMERTDYVINRKSARRIIEKIDERKARWRRILHDDSWDGPSESELVIEPGRIPTAEARQIIRAAVERPQYQTTPKSLDTIELLAIAAELRARIAMQGDVMDDNVDVEVRDGVITISGSMHSAEDLDAVRGLLD